VPDLAGETPCRHHSRRAGARPARVAGASLPLHRRAALLHGLEDKPDDLGNGAVQLRVGGFNKTSRRHEFGKLAAAFAHLTTAPQVIVQCEGRSYAHLGGEGLHGAAAALSKTLGVRYVGLLGHLDRGPIAPAVFYNPETLTVRSWVGHGAKGVFDDWRNIGWFTVNATGTRLGVIAQHWDSTCGDRRLFEVKQVGRFGLHPDPVLLYGDLNTSASGPHLPQRNWADAEPKCRHHEGIDVGDDVIADTRALDYLIGVHDEDCGSGTTTWDSAPSASKPTPPALHPSWRTRRP
jgi:hypothetical protein